MSPFRPARRLLPLLILVLAPLAAGCGRGAASVASAPDPGAQPLTREAATDIAAQIGLTLARDFGSGPGALSRTVAPALAGGSAAATQALADTADASLSFRIVVTFYDADGNEQLFYDPATTVRVHIERRVRGDLVTPHIEIGMGSAAFIDVTGIDPGADRLVTQGASDDTLDARFAATTKDPARVWHSVAGGSLEDIVQLKPVDQNPWPLSGVLRYAVEATLIETRDSGSTEASYSASVTVTFNGTPQPTIDFEEGSRYIVDLRTGQVLPA